MRLYAILRFCSFILASYVTATNANEVTIPSLDNLKSVPVGKLSAMEINGKLVLFSEDSRYVFDGKIIDTWAQEEIKTLEKMAYSKDHLPLKNLKFNPDEMNTITLGNGPEQVIVYVDPLCKFCKEFIQSAKNYIGDYTFKLIVVPALGNESNQLSRSLFCASDKSKSLEYFLDGNLSALPQKSVCDVALYDKTLIAAQLFGVQNVPFFIKSDGRFRFGAGPSIFNWLDK